jgi:hypothetical protein
MSENPFNFRARDQGCEAAVSVVSVTIGQSLAPPSHTKGKQQGQVDGTSGTKGRHTPGDRGDRRAYGKSVLQGQMLRCRHGPQACIEVTESVLQSPDDFWIAMAQGMDTPGVAALQNPPVSLQIPNVRSFPFAHHKFGARFPLLVDEKAPIPFVVPVHHFARFCCCSFRCHTWNYLRFPAKPRS